MERHTIKRNYYAHLKANEVRDDCNIETSKGIVNNRAWIHVQLNGVIRIFKGNPVRDDWNIQTSKYPKLHYRKYQKSLFSVIIKYCHQPIIHVNNKAWRNICKYRIAGNFGGRKIWRITKK